jgi:MFS family permease
MSEQAGRTAADIPRSGSIDARSNFGKWGWSIVILEGFMFWLASGATTHALNVVVPVLSGYFHMEPTTLLFWASPASWGSVIASYVLAWTCKKYSAKITTIVSLVACAVAFGLLGTWGGVLPFVILFFGVSFFGTGTAYVGGATMIANWFPRKKALAFGWATMGQAFSSAAFVPFLAWLFAMFGPQYGFWGISACMVVLAVAVFFLSTDTPEERGCTPDNLPRSVVDADPEEALGKSAGSTWQLLWTRDVWLIGVGSGGIYIVLIGVLSQLVPRLMALGMSLDIAILHLAVAAILGIPGAYVWGWLGTKLGTRRALIAYAGWWGLAVILNMLGLEGVYLYTSLFMIGTSFGGATNLTTSIIAEKYPRATFVDAFGAISPIQGIVRCCSFAILAFGLTYLGGFTGAYALLVGIAVVNMILFWVTDTTPLLAKA